MTQNSIRCGLNLFQSSFTNQYSELITKRIISIFYKKVIIKIQKQKSEMFWKLKDKQNGENEPINSQSIDLQHTLKQMLHNFPKLPLNPRELDHLYSQFISWNKIIDDSLKLKDILQKANQQSVLNEFQKLVNEFLDRLKQLFLNGKNIVDLKRLNQILLNIKPSYFQSSHVNLKKPLVTNTLQNQYKCKIQCYESDQEIVFEQRSEMVNFVLSLFFDHIQNLIIQYKNFYELQDISLLEDTISEHFTNFIKQNQQNFQEKKIQHSVKIQQRSWRKRISQKISGSKEESNKNSQSTFFNQMIDIVVKDAQDKSIIKKVSQKDQNGKAILTLKNYELKPLAIMNKGTSLLQSLTTKGLSKTLARGIHKVRDKSINSSSKYEIDQQEQEKVMKIAQAILKSHIRHNIHKQSGLSAEQFTRVEQFINRQQKIGLEDLSFIFTQNQKQILVQVLQSVQNQHTHFQIAHKKISKFLSSFSTLAVKDVSNQSKIFSIDGIFTTLSKIVSKPQTSKDLPNFFYFLIVLYEYLKQNYCTHIRRILLKICHKIELRQNEFSTEVQQDQKFCLVHVLKLLQSQHIKRSEVCSIITNQKPFRQSELPLINQKEQYFEEKQNSQIQSCENANKYLQLQVNRIHIFGLKKQFKEPAKIQLLKLSHSKNKKNVTILISGFLSEDTNKFEEWMGVLQPTYDSEIYALQWESKTIENIMQFIIQSCKDIALAGAGFGFLGGPFIKAALIFKQIISKYHSDPFKPCFQIATMTGIYFAQLIMSLFQNHFINLVGFSLGTQVIASALQRFKKKGKLHMINRVITLGGVADKNHMKSILESAEQTEQKPISVSWTNIYCQKDYILRYLLKISMPSIVPIGINQIQSFQIEKKDEFLECQKIQVEKDLKLRTYEVDNLNVSQFVDGHLSYRINMKNIARLIGIKDE